MTTVLSMYVPAMMREMLSSVWLLSWAKPMIY